MASDNILPMDTMGGSINLESAVSYFLNVKDRLNFLDLELKVYSSARGLICLTIKGNAMVGSIFKTLVILFLLTACTTFALANDPIKCAGCKTEHFLMNHLNGPFTEATGGELLTGKCGNKSAIQLMATGKIDFAYTCKPHHKLVKKFKISPELTADWVTTTIARDPIIIIVNQRTEIENLTVEELKSVFSGKIKNWSELGGKNYPVQLAYLDDTVESGVVTVFKETTMGKDGTLYSDAKKLGSPDQLGAFTKSRPGTVTFMSMNSYKKEYGTIVAIDGVLPENEKIVQGLYPLAVTYHLVTHKGDNPSNDFLKYLGTPAGVEHINEVMVALPQKEIMVP